MIIRKTLTGGIGLSLLAAGSLAIAGTDTSSAAELAEIDVPLERADLAQPVKTAKVRDAYERTYAQARKRDVEPKRNAAEQKLTAGELQPKLKQLREKVRKAKREPDFDSPQSVGVSQSTLESIAACESGGDPTAVSSGGDYRGKYQFDSGTWASVGGSGDPAAAPAAEQDYRAALLYSRAGSSPWPVCG